MLRLFDRRRECIFEFKVNVILGDAKIHVTLVPTSSGLLVLRVRCELKLDQRDCLLFWALRFLEGRVGADILVLNCFELVLSLDPVN